MAGVVSLKWRELASTPISYAKSAACAASANLRCIMQAKSHLPTSNGRHCASRAYQTRCRCGMNGGYEYERGQAGSQTLLANKLQAAARTKLRSTKQI
jgi:hypothetical protein